MVTSGKFFGANRTTVGTVVGVGASVALKFIGTREPLSAGHTEERSFSSVPTKVGFQMTSFSVESFTTGNMANMLLTTALIGSNNWW